MLTSAACKASSFSSSSSSLGLSPCPSAIWRPISRMASMSFVCASPSRRTMIGLRSSFANGVWLCPLLGGCAAACRTREMALFTVCHYRGQPAEPMYIPPLRTLVFPLPLAPRIKQLFPSPRSTVPFSRFTNCTRASFFPSSGCIGVAGVYVSHPARLLMTVLRTFLASGVNVEEFGLLDVLVASAKVELARLRVLFCVSTGMVVSYVSCDR